MSKTTILAITLGVVAACIAFGIFMKTKTCEEQPESKSVEMESVLDKPMLYLYPEEEMNIRVSLGKQKNITVSYPKYKDAWNVKADTDGTLYDYETKKTLYGLFYEARSDVKFEVEEDGFCVERSDISEFLDEKLKLLGLNAKERQEFIIYYLPILEKNKYNYIRFATRKEIDENMPLTIAPLPDTTIRVLMTYKPLSEPISVKEQKITKTKRTGFTAIEWGGTQIGG